MRNKSLKHRAPTLYKLKKIHSPFKVPEDYFEAVEASVNLRIKHKAACESAFKVPAGYFTSFEGRLFESLKVKKTSKKPAAVIPLSYRIKRYLVPASAAVLLIFAGLFFFDERKKVQISDRLAVDDWVESELLDFDFYDMDEGTTDGDFVYDALVGENDNEIFEYLSDSYLPEYLYFDN